jgi:hypothetical protein
MKRSSFTEEQIAQDMVDLHLSETASLHRILRKSVYFQAKN